MDINDLTLRQLQTESARAMTVIDATNVALAKFNKLAHHDSQKWYTAVIEWYVNEYGDLPSIAGPGKDVVLILDDNN